MTRFPIMDLALAAGTVALIGYGIEKAGGVNGIKAGLIGTQQASNVPAATGTGITCTGSDGRHYIQQTNGVWFGFPVPVAGAVTPKNVVVSYAPPCVPA